jgi:hypothetical protein
MRDLAAEGALDSLPLDSFKTAASGRRVVSLAAAQGSCDPGTFEIVLEAIDHPRSAFEQLQGLLAADALDAADPPVLDQAERRRLRNLIVKERHGRPDSLVEVVSEGTERWVVSERILRRPLDEPR